MKTLKTYNIINPNEFTDAELAKSNELHLCVKGTVVAYGKQIPLTPDYKELAKSESNYYEWNCGRCHKKHFSKTDVDYCCYCGQRVDWTSGDLRNASPDNTCVMCGKIIPEGRQICKDCEGS